MKYLPQNLSLGYKPNKLTPCPKPEKVEKKKVYKIKPLSDKRAVQNKAYLTLRKVYLENHKDCQIKGVGCSIKAVEIHHSYSGKDRGKYFLEISTWFSVCRNCHQWIHLNPKESRKLEYLK